MRRLVIAAASLGLLVMAARAFTQPAEPARVEIGDVSYSQDDISLSECILGGGTAYFAPQCGADKHKLSQYLGCNVHPKSIPPPCQ